MATEAGTQEPISEKNSQAVAQNTFYGAAAATDNSSVSQGTAKDETLHSVAVGMLDTSEGVFLAEAPSKVQVLLKETVEHSDMIIAEKLEKGGYWASNEQNIEATSEKDNVAKELVGRETSDVDVLVIDKERTTDEVNNDQLEISTSEQHNMIKEVDPTEVIQNESPKEDKFTDQSHHSASVTQNPIEESLQTDKSVNDHPIENSDSMSDGHILESICASQDTEKYIALNEEKPVVEYTVANRDQDFKILGDDMDSKKLEKIIDLVPEEQNFVVVEGRGKSEIQESAEEQYLEDDRRKDNEKETENEKTSEIVSSIELSQSQGFTSDLIKEWGDEAEKLKESSYAASDEKILKTLDPSKEQGKEAREGENPALMSVNDLPIQQLFVEKVVQENDMSSDKLEKESCVESEQIQTTSETITEAEVCTKEESSETNLHMGTMIVKKGPEEPELVRDRITGKDLEYTSSTAIEKGPKRVDASENIENEELEENKQPTNMEVLSFQNDGVEIINTDETGSLVYEESSLEMNHAIQNTGEILKKAESTNHELETEPVPLAVEEPSLQEGGEKFEESFNLKSDDKDPESIKIKDEETNKGVSDASFSAQLTEYICSLNEEKETKKNEEVSKVTQYEDQCHEKVLDHDEVDTQITECAMPDVSEAQAEDGLKEDEPHSATDNEKLERVFEAKHDKIMAENGSSDNESNNDIGGISMTEPSEKENTQEPPEVKTEEDLGPREHETEGGKLESPLDAVPNELEAIGGTTNPENTDNVEENSQEDEKKCEKNEKVAAELMCEYQNTKNDLSNETLTANKTNEESTDENVCDLPVAQEIVKETIQEGGEMIGLSTKSISEELIHDADDNIDQITRETDAKNLEKSSESVSEDQIHRTVAMAEATDFDNSGDGLSVDKAIGALFTLQASMGENIEKTMDPEEAGEKISTTNDDNEGHDRHTQGALQVVAVKDIDESVEGNRSVENAISEDEETNEATAGMSLHMEHIEGEKLSEGYEFEQGKDPQEVAVNSVISPEESPTEETPDCVLKKDEWEDMLEYDPGPACEKIIMAEQSAFAEDAEEKNHLEKQKSLKREGEIGVILEAIARTNPEDPCYRPYGKDEETVMVKDEDNLNDTVVEKHEEAPDSACEEQMHETTNTEDNREVDGQNEETSQKLELVLESVPEQKSQETTTETETVKIEKSKSEENGSNTNMTTNDLSKDTETANEENESSTENEVVKETIQEGVEMCEDATNSACEELNQNVNKNTDLIKQETKPENSEKAAQSLSEEHSYDTIAESETAAIDTSGEGTSTDEAIGYLSTSQASKEENAQKETDPEEAKEHISTATNENESHQISIGGDTEVVAEKDIHERTEEKRSMEAEATAGMSLYEDQMEIEQLDKRNELEQGKESSEVAVDGQIWLEKATTEETPDRVLQKDEWVDKLENPSDVVSEKFIVAEESSYTQHAEEKDLPEKQEESFQEKGDIGVTLEKAVAAMDTEDLSYKPDSAHVEIPHIVDLKADTETASVKDEDNPEKNIGAIPNTHVLSVQYIHDLMGDKHEESPNSACEEQTHETTNTNDSIQSDSQEQETSPKLNLVPESEPENKDRETSDEKEATKIKNSTNDDKVKNTIPEMVEPDDDTENAKDETNLNKNTGENPDSDMSVEETIHDAVGEKHEEGPSSAREEQIHQITNTEDNIEVDVCEEKTDTEQHGIISESLHEDKSQEATGESEATKIDNSTDADDPNIMIPGIADLTEDTETEKVKDEGNLNKNYQDTLDSHALVVPTLPEPSDEKHEDASESLCEEQIRQSTNAEENIEVDVHKEKTDSKKLEILPESVPEDHSQEDVGELEATKIYNSTHDDNLNKAEQISEMEDHIDNTETAKVKDENVHVLVAEVTHDGVGEKHENIHETTNTEVNTGAAVHKDRTDIKELDLYSESGPEDQIQDTICETESAKVEKAPSLQKDPESSILEEETTSAVASRSSSEQNVVEKAYELESNEKLESTSMYENRDEEVPKKEETLEKIFDKSSSIVSENSAEVDSHRQIIGEEGATKNAGSVSIECEENQKFEEATPESVYRDQNNERNEVNDNIKNGKTSEEVQESDTTTVAQTFETLAHVRPIEIQKSEDESHTMKVDAYEDQTYETKDECKEDTSIIHLNEETENINDKDEDNTNKNLDDLTVTSASTNEAALRSSHGGQGESASNADYTTTYGIRNQKNENIVAQDKESGAVDLKDEESITKSDDNLPDIPALNEETRKEVENKHEKAPDSSYEEQIHEGINRSDGIDLDILKEENNTEKLKRDSASMCEEQNHEEITGTGVGENDKTSEEAKTNYGDAFGSSMHSQGMEGGEVSKACELISEEKLEMLEPGKNQEEEIPMKEETFEACLGVPSDMVSKDCIVAAEVEHLSLQSTEKEEAINSIDGEENIETRGDTLSTKEASFDENTQEKASVVVSEQQIHGATEDINKAERSMLKNENKEEQEVQTSLQKEEVEDEKQDEENEMQKASETIDTNETNEKKSLEEKETSESGSEKEKLENLELEKPLHVVPEGLETATGNENDNDGRIKKQGMDNNHEENILKDGEKMLVASIAGLEPDYRNNEPIHNCDATEGAIPNEEMLKATNVSDEVANVDAPYEGNQCKMVDDLSVTHELVEEITDMEAPGSHLQMKSTELETLEKAEEKSSGVVRENEEITEKSEILDANLQKDAKELIQLEESSTTMFDSLEMADVKENIEKNIVAEKDAIEAAHEQLQEDEIEAKKNNEPETKWEPEATDHIPNDEVKESDCQLPQQNLIMMGSSEKIETALPRDEEDQENNLSASSVMASLSEETKQKVGEKFDKILDSLPKEYTEEALNANEINIEIPKEKTSGVEGQTRVEKFEYTSAHAASVHEINVEGKEIPDETSNVLSVTEGSGKDTIDQEGREKQAEVLNLVSNEQVNEKESSSAELTEDKDYSHKLSVVLEPEVNQPAEDTDRLQLAEGASHEEKQQTDLHDLPVSRFLMDHILREEGDSLNKACDLESKDKIHEENDGGEQNEVEIPKQEGILVSLSAEQVTEETSISEDSVGHKKLENSSHLVQEQQSHDVKENTEIPVVKDDVTPQSSLHDSSPTVAVGEDIKDEVIRLLSEVSTHVVPNDSMELTSTEQNTPGIKVDTEECMDPGLVQDEIIQATVREKMVTEMAIQKDNETLNKDVDVSFVSKASEEDTLQKEGGEEGKEILQDVEKIDKNSYAVTEGQSTSISESIGDTNSLAHSEETLPNPQHDQTGKSSESSIAEDHKHGKTLEIELEVKRVENEEKQDVITGNQVQIVKNDLTEEPKLSESQKVQQSDLAVESTIQSLWIDENFLEERSSAVSLDEKQTMETTDAKVDEDKTDEEKDEKEEEDEHKPEESGHDATVIVDARDANLKPAHKKSHNILSGVGSKVKHSIAKVKKAITGKSSHSKTLSTK